MIKKILQEGFLLKHKGYYNHAIEAFYKALEIDSTSLELLYEIAESYYLMGEEERALSYIEQILEKNPAHITSLTFLKNIFVTKSAWVEAKKTAENIYKITNKEEDFAEILKLLNKQFAYNEVIKMAPESNNSAICYELSVANFHINNLVEAETNINKALESDSNNQKYLILKAKILFKMNRMEESADIINNIQIDFENADFLNFIGLIKQYECQFKTAIEYFKQAIKLAPQNDEYFYNCASTYFKTGDITQAKKYYNLAISLNPDNPNYHFALANLYYSEKQYKRAMEELKYDFFEANLLKSIILYDTGYVALAKKQLESLHSEQPENELINKYKNLIEEKLKI